MTTGPIDASGRAGTARGRARGVLTTGVALVCGLLLGSCVLLTWQDRAPAARSPATTSGRAPAALLPAPFESTPPTSFPSKTAEPPADAVLLAWSGKDLPVGFAARVHDATGHSATEVRHGTVWLDLPGTSDPSARRIPMDTIGIDPHSYRDFVSPTVVPIVGALGDGDALLSETSARVRRTGRGGVLSLRAPDPTAPMVDLTVAEVVPDATIGGAEVAVTTATATRLGLDAVRYALVAGGDRLYDVQRQVTPLVPAPSRIRATGETPYLRDTDAVLPQAIVKDRFGEFAYRIDGDRVSVEPAWERQNITTEDVPLLGSVRCHRSVLPALRDAMTRVERENLGWLIDPAGFGGCFNPKRIRDRDELSRHSWGIAVDLNYARNETGKGSLQDSRLVKIMGDAGFVWGGSWLVPEPAYFEYVGGPQAT